MEDPPHLALIIRYIIGLIYRNSLQPQSASRLKVLTQDTMLNEAHSAAILGVMLLQCPASPQIILQCDSRPLAPAGGGPHALSRAAGCEVWSNH
jgi:hypothetical protein